MVPVYALLLFGGAMSVQHEQGCIQLDGWATFQAPAKIAALVGGVPPPTFQGSCSHKAIGCCINEGSSAQNRSGISKLPPCHAGEG